ncbi:MAG: hypothetical protein DME25_13670, partial [Verrucomicrobia bacterium]
MADWPPEVWLVVFPGLDARSAGVWERPTSLETQSVATVPARIAVPKTFILQLSATSVSVPSGYFPDTARIQTDRQLIGLNRRDFCFAKAKNALYPGAGFPMGGYEFTRLLPRAFALFMAAATPAAVPPDRAFFLPPQVTVVLLVGLPGDLESENTYRDQLQSWLEIVRSDGRAQRVFVLCDNPESAGLAATGGGRGTERTNRTDGAEASGRRPEPALMTVLKADRTNFLSLGQSLAGRTNPLEVIAWGHGGKQGSSSVFHVRGPRITAADFKALALQAGAADSRWILMFRGSGIFAGQLAGEGRQILSSESDTMFTSDPVGMSLLLKLARAGPTISPAGPKAFEAGSFRVLGEQFGRAVAAWYKDRNLALTEEPTLWVGDEKPRMLAPAAEAGSLASIEPGEHPAKAATPTTDEPKETSAKRAGEATAATSDLPAAWKEIVKVDPQKYPQADAAILRRRVSYTLGSSPALASEEDEFTQILTAEGKRFGDFDISYSPPFEDITFLDCEVLRPDGKLTRLDPEAIREAGEEPVGDYQRGRRKFFSLPGVVPGTVLHVRYRTQWKTFPLPHVSLEIPLERESPVLESNIEVSVPKNEPFHFALDPAQASDPLDTRHPTRGADPTVKQTTYGAIYSWRFRDLPAREHELLSSPGQRSALLISTFADWATFADWYGRISKLADEITPEIAAKAAELTREAKSDRDKVLALYNYVTRLRYVAVPLGVNSFRPHAAAKVLQNQFG